MKLGGFIELNPIAITGIGVASPVGLTPNEMWANLIEGNSGVGRIDHFDPSEFPCQLAAQINNFDADEIFGERAARRLDRFVQFAMYAAREAFSHSGFSVGDSVAVNTGVYIGSGIGGLTTLSEQTKVLEDKGNKRVSPFLIPMMIPNMSAGQVAIDLGLTGPSMAHVSACASGAHSIGEAAAVINRGDASVMLAGGSEAAITPIALAGFTQGRAMSTKFNDKPHQASRPFDADRDGFVSAEGAGMLVLEDMEHAKARGAEIHAVLIGYGASSDAFHMTQPPNDGAGAALAMSRAINSANIDASDIDYLNAHATSTPVGDAAEVAAIKSVFGNHTDKMAVSSTKSVMGHLIGAAGAVEAIVSILALSQRAIPPTINYDNPDPDCDLDVVPNEARSAEVNVALSNSFGFGGQNAALIFARN